MNKTKSNTKSKPVTYNEGSLALLLAVFGVPCEGDSTHRLYPVSDKNGCDAAVDSLEYICNGKLDVFKSKLTKQKVPVASV